MSEREAVRLRVRQEDLERIADHMVRQLVVLSPELSCPTPPAVGDSITMAYDTDSAGTLLRDLCIRLNAIAHTELARAAEPTEATVAVSAQVSAPA